MAPATGKGKGKAVQQEDPLAWEPDPELESLPGGWREHVYVNSPKFADTTGESHDQSTDRKKTLYQLLSNDPQKDERKGKRKGKGKAAVASKNNVTEDARLESLPILARILPYLDQSDVFSLARLCRSIYILLSNGDYYRWNTVRRHCGPSECTVDMTKYHERNAEVGGPEYLENVPSGHTEDNVEDCVRCGRATCYNCTAVKASNPRIIETLFIMARYLCPEHISLQRTVQSERSLPTTCPCRDDYPRFCFPCHDYLFARGSWYTNRYVRPDKGAAAKLPRGFNRRPGTKPGQMIKIKVKLWCRCGEPAQPANVFCDLCGGQHQEEFKYDVS